MRITITILGEDFTVDFITRFEDGVYVPHDMYLCTDLGVPLPTLDWLRKLILEHIVTSSEIQRDCEAAYDA